MRLVSQSSSVVWKVKMSPQERSGASGKLMINTVTSRLHNFLQHIQPWVWKPCVCLSVICMCTHTSTNQTGERARGLLSLKPLELKGFNQQVDKLYPLHLPRCHPQPWAVSWAGMGGSARPGPPQAANRQELLLAILNFLLCPLKESFLLLCSF